MVTCLQPYFSESPAKGMEMPRINMNTLSALRKAVDQATADYIHTVALCTYPARNRDISLDIRDLLLIAAVTESDVLLTGKTGSGKTRLANGVVQGLFGQNGWYAKTTLPTMNASEFMDVDFPAIIEGRKTLSEAVSGVQSLIKPGIVLNEVNRAPAVVQSLLIAFLDRELEVQGIPVEMGKQWSEGHYQLRILTINEGDLYQVQELDPAIRDRITIEIPIDAFQQSKQDVQTMLARKKRVNGFGQESNGEKSYFEQVIRIRKAVEDFPLHPRAQLFLNYLSGLSYCVRAPRGNKESIALSPEVCEGCHHHAAFYNLCGNIMAPSARSLLRLQQVARAFAFFRCWKKADSEKALVLPQDIIEAAPFVLYSKLYLNPLWLRTAGDRTRPFWGDRWTAIREILSWIYRERFLPLVNPGSQVGEFMHRISQGQALITGEWEKLYNYLLEKDPWVCDPAMVKAHLSGEEEKTAQASAQKKGVP